VLYCKGHGLVQTRSRAYKKNDQTWVEQKSGSIVRRLVGYGRLSGAEATKALATLYASDGPRAEEDKKIAPERLTKSSSRCSSRRRRT
jgi:hypothetical protein